MFGSALPVIIYAPVVGLVTGHAIPIDTTINSRSLEKQRREKQPWAAHDVQCHNEADFPGHADIHAAWQWEATKSFCDSDQGKRIFTTYQDPAENHYPVVYRLRYRWKDMWKVNYDFYVQWVAGCRTAFGNNGGVGGATQVGCLLYTFNGGKGDNLLTASELQQRKIYDEKNGITRVQDP
ncbi:hypothetical protein CSAL01_11318 [Colletotrichum salicis]|uniref:Uncharacterized protein n=1 Tax=Colletotrichum salicis TaxID=1209931 RepID=A0A135U4Q7_9PEZI|nr:hypothetical protein CSAL01_11318 [Colletotrichum salicis]